MNICSWKNEVQVFSIPNIYPWDQRWTCRAELLCFYQLYLLGKKYWWTMCQLNLQYALVMLALSYLRLAFRTQEKQLPLKKSSRKHGIGRLTDRQTDKRLDGWENLKLKKKEAIFSTTLYFWLDSYMVIGSRSLNDQGYPSLSLSRTEILKKETVFFTYSLPEWLFLTKMFVKLSLTVFYIKVAPSAISAWQLLFSHGLVPAKKPAVLRRCEYQNEESVISIST